MRRSSTPKAPIVILRQSLLDAREGIEPPFNSESLVRSIGLEDGQPDNKSLMDRFVGNSSLRGALSELRALVYVNRNIGSLIVATNERSANPAQETIAQALGAVVCRQFEREQRVCPLVADVATMSTRDDIIPDDVRLAIMYAPITKN